MNIIYQGAKIQKILERYGIFKNFITENNYGKSFDNKNKHEKDVIHSRIRFFFHIPGTDHNVAYQKSTHLREPKIRHI